MTKKLIIKYISGKVSEEEEKMILDWVNKSEENLKYFISLKNLWMLQNMPESSADSLQMEDAKKIIESSCSKRNTFKFPALYKYAAAVIVILLALNLYFVIDGKTKVMQKQAVVYPLSAIPAEYKHTLYTNNGIKGYAELPDGSKVWLNSASKLVYPDRFLGDTREVELSGEAFFDVVRNPQKPMIVNTNRRFKIEVLGTKFNVRSYDNDNESQTTLISGSIKLIQKDSVSGKEIVTHLNPKESFLIRDNRIPVLIKQVDTTKQIAWKRGKLIFDETPMSEVIKMLERWHGKEFIVKDPEILNYKITANFKSESIVEIMEMIKFCTMIDYSIQNNCVLVRKKV